MRGTTFPKMLFLSMSLEISDYIFGCNLVTIMAIENRLT